MKKNNKTNEQLLDKISKLNDKIAELEKFKAERKQIEEALRIERDNLNNIFEAMEDGIYIVNQQYDIQYVNPVLTKDFGIYEGRKCYEYFHDRTKVCPWCKLSDVLAGKTVRWEWYSLKNQRTYDLIDTSLKNPDGSISKLEIFRDITERKQAEEKLNKANRLYATLSQINQAIVRERDKQKLFQEICNIAVEFGKFRLAWIGLVDEENKLVKPAAFSGKGSDYLKNIKISLTNDITRKGPTGRSIREGKSVVFNDLENNPNFVPWRKQALEKGYRSSAAFPIRLNNSVIGALNVYAVETHFFDEDEIKLLEEAVLDISFALEKFKEEEERIRAEEALENSEERLKIIFELAPDAYYMNDLKGTFIAGNIAAEEITGYKREELIGKNFIKSKLLSPNQIPKAAALLVRNVMGQSTGPDEFILNRQDGTQVPVEIKTFPVKIKDQKSVLSIARDITERKQAEEERKKLQSQLLQTQRLEAIGTLAGGIAHDFNNILSIILGYTELALVDMDKKTTLYGHLEAVFEAGKKARDLVKQILTFSRQDEQDFIPIQLKPLIKEALKLFRFSMPSRVELKLDFQSDSIVLADPTQIHQVFLNLCTNANHAMQEKGGVLDIKLLDVELDSDSAARYPDVKPGPYVKLTVSDTGHGIPAEVLERVFDPFFTTKAKDGGTGMGLSVVHGIVKNHRGTITVYSEPGEGSTFNVFLPADKTGTGSDSKNKKPIPKGIERILFVDDEKTFLNMGKQMLESLSYKVTAKTSSVEALKLFKSQPDRFDLVITDMAMPNITGEELAKEVLAIRPDIPVILCTEFSAKIDKKKANALGFRAYILKPILKRQMAETIREMLDSQKEKRG